jgi:hypothetical protein
MVTADQRRSVAAKLIIHAGHLIEHWDEMTFGDPELCGVTSQEASELIGRWLHRLPGDQWDTRLKMPEGR